MAVAATAPGLSFTDGNAKVDFTEVVVICWQGIAPNLLAWQQRVSEGVGFGPIRAPEGYRGLGRVAGQLKVPESLQCCIFGRGQKYRVPRMDNALPGPQELCQDFEERRSRWGRVLGDRSRNPATARQARSSKAFGQLH